LFLLPYLRNTRLVKPADLLTVACAVLFLTAMLVQYGFTLQSDHGFSLPVGVPLILVTGIWLVCGEFEAGKKSAGDDKPDAEDRQGTAPDEAAG